MKKIQILCLVTISRAGSKLLHSLLDSHKNIICFPRTFNFYNFWNQNHHLINQPNLLIDQFIKDNKRFFNREIWGEYNPLDKMNDKRENFNFSTQKFKKLFLNQFNKKRKIGKRKNLFLSLHLAYANLLNKNLNEKNIILYHLHAIYGQEEALKQIVNDFDANVKFIMMTRNPIDSMRSISNWMDKVSFKNIYDIFYYQSCCFADSQFLKNSFKKNYIKVITFESLHKNSKDVMKALSKWMEIKWSNNLLKSTFCGKIWTGNSHKILKGLNKNKIKKINPNNFFEKNDQIIYQSIFPYRMKLYGYYNNLLPLTYSRIILFIRVLIPTNSEISMLQSFFSIKYLYSIYLYHKNLHKFKHNHMLKNRYMFNNIYYICFISYCENLFKYLFFYLKRIITYFRVIKNKIPDYKKDIVFTIY